MHDADLAGDDFAYGAPRTSLSIYADRIRIRSLLREDAEAAGLTVAHAGCLDDLQADEARPLGDIVLIDCPQADARRIALLSRLDGWVRRSGIRLIVSTSVDALDCVFSCMDQSCPILLVDPSRAERVLALGQVLAATGGSRVRELSEDDRLMLLRLSEQVGQIAGQIERLGPGTHGAGIGAKAMANFQFAERSGGRQGAESPRQGATGLPAAGLVRGMIRHRQLRARYFEGDFFADPAWDMLLDLTAARVEGKRVSVTSLCIASGVPPTTALRWIGQMVEAGLFVRVCDDSDRRRAFIELSDHSHNAMARYFAETDFAARVPA